MKYFLLSVHLLNISILSIIQEQLYLALANVMLLYMGLAELQTESRESKN